MDHFLPGRGSFDTGPHREDKTFFFPILLSIAVFIVFAHSRDRDFVCGKIVLDDTQPVA